MHQNDNYGSGFSFPFLESVLGDVTSISFIKQLKQVTPAEREEELAKKITASKDILAKLLEFVQNAEKTSKELVQQLTEGKQLARTNSRQKESLVLTLAALDNMYAT